MLTLDASFCPTDLQITAEWTRTPSPHTLAITGQACSLEEQELLCRGRRSDPSDREGVGMGSPVH